LIWQLVFLGMALGMNNALASIALGTSNMPRVQQLKTALVFAVFEALMPIIGIVIGESLAGEIGNKAKWVGVFVLAGTGVYALFKKDDEENNEGSERKGTLNTMLLAVALSLDNLSVGFGLGMLEVPLAIAACIFGAVSLVMTLIGLEVGRLLGARVNVSADKLSGVVLLLVAGVMLLT